MSTEHDPPASTQDASHASQDPTTEQAAPQELYEQWVRALEAAGIRTFCHWDELTEVQQERWLQVYEDTQA